MQASVFDFPVAEFGWYGLVSVASLLCFASLSYEVRRALQAIVGRQDLRAVILATYHVNFAVMVAANLAMIGSCIGIAIADGENWRAWFALSIMACGAYWSYTRACERKLLAWLERNDVRSLEGEPTGAVRGT